MTNEPERSFDIDRREALRRVSAMLGGVAFIGGSSLLAACSNDRKPAEDSVAAGNMIGSFTPQDVAFLDEVADTILPTTSTPGAKAAKVGAFMALMVTDTYEPKDQSTFRDGMKTLDEASQKTNNVAFMQSTAEPRLALLTTLDQEAKTYMQARTEGAPPHYFRMMKELTLLGYFTSEIGYTKAMRYVESPGRYDGCAPYAPGEKSWASHA